MKNAYLQFKYHKPNFDNNLQSGFFNNSKTETKFNFFLKYIIKRIRNIIQEISYKNKDIFIQFYLIEIYPSISKNLFLKRLNFAKQYVDVTDDEFGVILASRKRLLIKNTYTCYKSYNVEVTMGAYDSAQISDLEGIYLLNIRSRIIDPKLVGLNRYDGHIFI